MTKRYWIATLGNWLGIPLALFGLALIITQSRFAIAGGSLLYAVGFATRHFMDVMDEEYRAQLAKDKPHDKE